jgi:hypothetical protein
MESIMDKNDILKLSDDWNLHKEDLKVKKYYLFNVKDGDIVKLNEVSFEILKNINGIRTLQDIHNLIFNTFSVDTDVLWKDLFSLIEKCSNENAVKKI